MRIHFCLLLLICAIWLQLSASAPIDESPSKMSEKILPITRVLAAVTIQHEICQNETSAVAIVGELINVNKNHLVQTLEFNTSDQLKQILDASSFIDKIPSFDAQNAQKTINGLGALSKLKQQENLMNRQSFKNPTDALKSAAGLRKKLMKAKVNFQNKRFQVVIDALVQIEKVEAKEGKKEEFDLLFTLLDKVEKAESLLKLIQTYENTYSELFSYSDLETRTLKYVDLLKTMGEVGKSHGDIIQLDTAVPLLTSQSTMLRSQKQDFDKYQKQFTETSSNLNVINQLLKSESDKVSTNGFPNGLDDLKRVKKDFDSSSFLGVIVQDRDANNIKNALIPLTSTSKSLDLLENDRKKLSLDANTLNNFMDFTKLFSDVVDASNHALKNQDLENSLQSLVGCVNQLKPDPNMPNFQDLDKIIKYVKLVVSKMNAFKSVMKTINEQKDLDKFIKAFGSLGELSRDLPETNQAAETVKVWNNIRGLKFYETWKQIFDLIQQFDPDPFFFGTVDFKIDLLDKVMTSAETMNLFDTVKCLPSAFPDIHTLLDSGRKIEEIKNQKAKLTSISPILTNAQKFQRSANTTIVEMKKTKTQNATKMICGFPNDFGKKLSPFVNGGHLFSDFLMIKNSEKSINSVAKPSGPVKIAAGAVPNADSVYNDDFRKQIVEVLERVEKQLKTISSMPTNTLDGIITILEILAKVKGYAPKNFQVMGQIAEELSQNSNQEVKTAAKDFEIVSNLHMDFASRTSSGPMNPNAIQSNIILMFPALQSGLPMMVLNNMEDYLQWLGMIVFGSLAGEILFGSIFILILCFCLRRRLKKRKSKGKKKAGKRKSKKKKRMMIELITADEYNKNFKFTEDMKKSKNTKSTEKSKEAKAKKSKSTDKKNDKKGKDKKSKSKEKSNANKDEEMDNEVEVNPNESATNEPTNEPGKHPAILATVELCQKVRDNAARNEAEHKEITNSKNFKKKGPIPFEREPKVPKVSDSVNDPDDVTLANVTYDPNLNEQWDIGSQVDAIEKDPLVSTDPYDINTASVEDSIKDKKEVDKNSKNESNSKDKLSKKGTSSKKSKSRKSEKSKNKGKPDDNQVKTKNAKKGEGSKKSESKNKSKKPSKNGKGKGSDVKQAQKK